jgi:hypothetical protein
VSALPSSTCFAAFQRVAGPHEFGEAVHISPLPGHFYAVTRCNSLTRDSAPPSNPHIASPTRFVRFSSSHVLTPFPVRLMRKPPPFSPETAMRTFALTDFKNFLLVCF